MQPLRNYLHLLILSLVFTSGCIVVNNDEDSASGRRIQSETLNQFEVGTTTKAWTLSVLGEPTHREIPEEGTEIFKYVYSRKKEKQTVVFLVFAGNSDKKERQTTYFEFKDDLLTRFWAEKD